MDKSTRFGIRVNKEFFGELDRWRRRQDDLPSRAEAIRRLVSDAVYGPSPRLAAEAMTIAFLSSIDRPIDEERLQRFERDVLDHVRRVADEYDVDQPIPPGAALEHYVELIQEVTPAYEASLVDREQELDAIKIINAALAKRAEED